MTKKQAKSALVAQRAKAVNFKTLAEQYIAQHEAGWKNAKHAAQWTSTLETYAFPTIGNMVAADIDTPSVLRVLQPIWTEKSETASRLRGRIEAVLDFATAKGLREGPNPARWKGNLALTLPAKRKVSTVKHHPAVPVKDMPSFFKALRSREGMAARALEFLTLTAARSGEVRGAQWNEIDLAKKVWVIPAERMKAKREHRVPLSTQAIALLKSLDSRHAGGLVFSGRNPTTKLSDMALTAVMRRMELDAVPHGLRSSFRDWVGEETSYPREVAEMALAHTVGNAVEAAYPPKKIISMATGIPVSEFSGGRQSNEYLKNQGFEIIAIDNAVSGPLEAPKFVVGKVYDRWPDINVPFGGSRQSGISPSNKTPAIFLFTGDSGEQYGYRDEFDADGVFSYTGEGQVGDMQITKGNLSITNHARDGRALHVFESLGKGKGQKYIGEFIYVNHSFQRGPDREGNDRRIIVFHLVPVGRETDDLLTDEIEENQLSGPAPNLAEARKRALSAFGANEGSGGKQAKKNLYIRNRAVRDYVLLRSRGECESCHEPAPFKRVDGSPYLEPHHTTRVSDGGLDHPRFVGAICPTCHREIHHGLDGKRRNAELTEYLTEIEPLN